MGTTDLRKIQIGKESTWGTGVAATAVFGGVTDFKWNAGVVNQLSTYLDGTVVPAQKVTQVAKQPRASITQDATPEDILYVLDAGFNLGVITGAGPYTHTYSAPTTSQTIASRTIEFTDSAQEYEMEGAHVTGFSISSALNDVWKVSSNWIGQEIIKSTVTGALSNRAFTLMPSALTQVWIDDIGGTVGTTAVAATLIGFQFQCGSGVHTKQFMDGAITPSAIGKGRLTGTLSMTLEANATGVAELDKYLAGTGRLVRLKSTNGSASLQLDFAGDITNHNDAWEDRDGNTTLTLNLSGRYDSGAFANWCKIVAVNAVSALVA